MYVQEAPAHRAHIYTRCIHMHTSTWPHESRTIKWTEHQWPHLFPFLVEWVLHWECISCVWDGSIQQLVLCSPAYGTSTHEGSGRHYSGICSAYRAPTGEMKMGFFIKGCSDRTRANGFQLNEDRLKLDIRNKFFIMRVMRSWHRLPREAVDVPSLEVLKPILDVALGNLT